MKKKTKPNFKIKIILETSILIFLIVSLCYTFDYLVNKYQNINLDIKIANYILSKEDILLACSLIGGLGISFFFKRVGKSIKAMNDFILFTSAAIVVFKAYDQNKDDLIAQLEGIINIHTLAIFKTLILICSFAKIFISAIEFYSERKMEIDKKYNSKSLLINDISSTINLLNNIKNKKH
ncbi:hypothetical protein MDR57_001961 [Salmonella enterica]|nr:hypothetical protein [Salmonella enterica]EAU4595865.1 hypothetical protein [Salmonella enterica]EBI8002929.1 hypothetical protein [Salmonella enterica]EBS7039557.1 hypothetical protein [Salmonella enterica]EFR2913867.1 hypothetical protein [Salmonella enterica]